METFTPVSGMILSVSPFQTSERNFEIQAGISMDQIAATWRSQAARHSRYPALEADFRQVIKLAVTPDPGYI